jgi:glycosyltransferase involved in cell wall biosynthesis
VRGPFLNAAEYQSFRPLSAEFDIRPVAASHAGQLGDDASPEILRLPCLSARLLTAGPAGRVGAAVLRRAYGAGFFLAGLEEHLSSFDIIHTAETFHGFSVQPARLRRLLDTFRLVVTHWENLPFAHEEFSQARAVKQTVRGTADLFLATSKQAAVALELEGVEPERVRVIYPGIDLERFRPQPRDAALLDEWGLPDDAFVLLFVGRLVREKGVHELLCALGLIRDSCPSVVLVYVGEGPERRGLLRRANDLGLTGAVLVRPPVPYSEMPAVHNLADVFCLPSVPAPKWQEQFGMVLVESMACGKPVVSTLSGAIPEVVGDAGLLVQPGDPLSLAQALQWLLDSPALRQESGAAGRERAATLFDANNTARQIGEAYRSVLRKSPH